MLSAGFQCLNLVEGLLTSNDSGKHSDRVIPSGLADVGNSCDSRTTSCGSSDWLVRSNRHDLERPNLL